MKFFILLVASLVLSLPSLADEPDYRYPGGPLEVFGCGPVVVPGGKICNNGDFYGQTLNNRPVEANVTAQLIGRSASGADGATYATARVIITKITDPTDFYHPDGTEAVQVVAHLCSYHRTCEWTTSTSSFVITRTYGQRYFENLQPIDFQLTGWSGAEQTQILTSIDIWLPQQQYPITVKFSNY